MFVSDNVSCVCAEVMQAIEVANSGDAVSYGGDKASHDLEAAFSDYFEKPVCAFPVGTGTASNALALSLATPRFGAIYCHKYAHIETTECGASEAWAGGSKLVLLPGDHCRIDVQHLKAALERLPTGDRPQVAMPAVVSVSQGTEIGTIYSPDEVGEISRLAHDRGLLVHMDGARFTNALVKSGCTPAEMAWRAGIDILSYGATKNGGMCAEAVVIFNPELITEQRFLRRRTGQLFSKMRYLSAQLTALIRNGVAERNAGHANETAKRLSEGLSRIPGSRLLAPVDINEIFIFLPKAAAQRLETAGYEIKLRNDDNGPHYRFVTAWNSSVLEIDKFIALAANGGNAAKAM